MALINCPECQRQTSEKATTCPHCGSPVTIDRPANWSRGFRRMFVVACVLWAGVALVWFPMHLVKEKHEIVIAMRTLWISAPPDQKTPETTAIYERELAKVQEHATEVWVYRHEWAIILAALVLPLAALYGTGWLTLKLIRWLARGFAGSAQVKGT